MSKTGAISRKWSSLFVRSRCSFCALLFERHTLVCLRCQIWFASIKCTCMYIVHVCTYICIYIIQICQNASRCVQNHWRKMLRTAFIRPRLGFYEVGQEKPLHNILLLPALAFAIARPQRKRTLEPQIFQGWTVFPTGIVEPDCELSSFALLLLCRM